VRVAGKRSFTELISLSSFNLVSESQRLKWSSAAWVRRLNSFRPLSRSFHPPTKR